MEEGRIYSPFYLFFPKKLKLEIEESRLVALHSSSLSLDCHKRDGAKFLQSFSSSFPLVVKLVMDEIPQAPLKFPPQFQDLEKEQNFSLTTQFLSWN